ncbi:hypothetical protein VCCP1035_0919 [Vibrio cholerae CP1035(8)]|nr:hypothetical protein VCCP1035_0919 [Vibrio cholerae CP1035(8)]
MILFASVLRSDGRVEGEIFETLWLIEVLGDVLTTWLSDIS